MRDLYFRKGRIKGVSARFVVQMDELNTLVEIKSKDELLASQQRVISMLISDVAKEGNLQKSKPVNNHREERIPSKIHAHSESERNHTVISDSDSDTSDEGASTRVYGKTKNITFKRDTSRRPNVVTREEPEGKHFLSNNRNLASSNKRPLIALIGDSTLKNLSGYQLSKTCKGASVLVRSQRGGKFKSIKNLMINLLEDMTPDAICFHVGTNDLNAGKSMRDIIADLNYMIKLTQDSGIVPVLSLVTQRSDKFSSKVYQLNQMIVELCNDLGVGYIEHQNINSTHLNESGLHIAAKYTYLFSDNFARYFNSLINNDFILV